MKQIDNVLISDEVWYCNFACDLSQCLGRCCQYGDLGSPLEEQELSTIQKLLPEIEHMLSKQQRAFLRAGIAERFRGCLHIREIGNNVPCPLSFKDKAGILYCSLHDYTIKNQLPILSAKPFWCALAPLMIDKTETGWNINVLFLEFCRSTKNAPPILFTFKEILTSVFGEEWFAKVEHEYSKEK